MNSQEFVKVVELVVRDSSLKGVLKQLKSPSGRVVPEELKKLSQWYLTLGDENQEMVIEIIKEAIDASVFGVLCVLDGCRAIEDSDNKGELILIYENETQVRLNPSETNLHELYEFLR